MYIFCAESLAVMLSVGEIIANEIHWSRYADPNVSLQTQRGPSQLTSLAIGHPKMAKLEEIVLDHFVQFREGKWTVSNVVFYH